MPLKIGQKAPGFKAATADGSRLSLGQLAGNWLILYFYPKDNTSGCTKEACDFRDNMERITATGAVVIGVSPDSQLSHSKFAEKLNLNFLLLADNEKKISTDYGAWVEKSLYGRKFMGVERTTFVIDTEGIIRHIFPKVKVGGHVDTIIGKLNELMGK
jgi:peroxiredoxin Q/BCP